jgi:hypothetical protein
MDCRTWLREPCRPRTAIASCGRGVDMSFTCRLNSTGETSPPWPTQAHMPRHVAMADWKDVWNVRQSRYVRYGFHEVRREVQDG